MAPESTEPTSPDSTGSPGIPEGPGGAGAGRLARAAGRWGQVWQLPTLLVGLGLFVFALRLAMPVKQAEDFAGALKQLESLIDEGKHAEARERIKHIGEHLDRATKEEQARFQLLSGDLLFDETRERKTPDLAAHKLIQRFYTQAREMGLALDAAHKQRLAESLAALGEDAQALQVLEALHEEPARRRYTVVRGIVERRLAGGDAPQKLTPLLDRFLDEVDAEEDQDVRRDQQIWAVSLKMRGLIAAGDPAGAKEQLQRHLLRLKDTGKDAALAPLHVTLAKANQALGAFAEAERQYRVAQALVPEQGDLVGDILLGQATIQMNVHREFGRALDLFLVVERDFPGTAAHWDASLGLAECEAQLGNDTEAIRHALKAAHALKASPAPSTERRDRLAAFVRGRHGLHSDKEDHALALHYLEILPALFPEHLAGPDEGLFAASLDQLGQQLLDKARKAVSPDSRREFNREAWKRFIAAAGHYERHAREAMAKDPAKARESLWLAAGAYDRSNEWPKAVRLYRDFVDAGDTDPRRVEALGRLALALLADRQFDQAIGIFRTLEREHPANPLTHAVLVPLARALAAKGDVAEAKRVLAHVLDHGQIRPESQAFREALIELGVIHHRQGEFAPAIERLDQAVKRYGDGREGPNLRFALADSYRQSVSGIEKDLAEPGTQEARNNLMAERARRLEQAQAGFEQVVAAMKPLDRRAMTDLDFLQFRNAYFYRADCAFDLRKFEEAIKLYDEAASKWSEHPSSLIALVQIVNANCELGRIQEARIANQRAREQLKRIPEDAFQDKSLPMTRQHWQDWLRWTDDLDLFGGKPGPRREQAAAVETKH